MVIWQSMISESILTPGATNPVKMQSAVPAGKSGIVNRVVVSPNHVVDAGDLLVVIE